MWIGNGRQPIRRIDPIETAPAGSIFAARRIFHADPHTSCAVSTTSMSLAISCSSVIALHITFIAHRWGFSEASSLSRAFRVAYQTSPRRYRQTKQADGLMKLDD
jgi:AraC-like DNA-binding protein